MNTLEDLKTLRAEVIQSMIDYMKPEDEDPEFDAGYEQQHVDQCAALLDGFIASMSAISQTGSTEQILKVTKDTVIALNDLNETCDSPLIETEQRELICDLILSGARLAGFESDVDITEEWREW